MTRAMSELKNLRRRTEFSGKNFSTMLAANIVNK